MVGRPRMDLPEDRIKELIITENLSIRKLLKRLRDEGFEVPRSHVTIYYRIKKIQEQLVEEGFHIVNKWSKD